MWYDTPTSIAVLLFARLLIPLAGLMALGSLANALRRPRREANPQPQ